MRTGRCVCTEELIEGKAATRYPSASQRENRGNQPCWFLDPGLVASKSVRTYISAVSFPTPRLSYLLKVALVEWCSWSYILVSLPSPGPHCSYSSQLRLSLAQITVTVQQEWKDSLLGRSSSASAASCTGSQYPSGLPSSGDCRTLNAAFCFFFA